MQLKNILYKSGLSELILPHLWPVLPYFLRYRISLLIERFRDRASVEVPESPVAIYCFSDFSASLFPLGVKVNDESLVESMPFSLIVSCKGEKNTIQQFLNSLSEQRKPPDELVFVDAGGEKEVQHALLDWAKTNANTEVVYLAKPDINIASARNLGVSRASKELIAFADLGTHLNKEWGARLTAPFKDPKIECSMGWYYAKGDLEWQQEIIKFIMPTLKTMSVERFLPSTRSLAIKKSSFLKCGGFLEILTLAGEDSLFGYEMKKKGVNLAFVPDAFVSWDLPKTPLEMWKKLYKYSKGDAETGFLFWQHYFNLIMELGKIFLDLVFVFIALLMLQAVFSLSSFVMWLITVTIILMFPVRRILAYFHRFGEFGHKPFLRIFVLAVLSSAQSLGFISGLNNLRKNKILKSLYCSQK